MKIWERPLLTLSRYQDHLLQPTTLLGVLEPESHRHRTISPGISQSTAWRWVQNPTEWQRQESQVIIIITTIIIIIIIITITTIIIIIIIIIITITPLNLSS